MKNGIVYCDPPIKTDLYDFVSDHLGCNCVIKKGYSDACSVEILAYSSERKYNEALSSNFKHDKSVEIVHGFDDSI